MRTKKTNKVVEKAPTTLKKELEYVKAINKELMEKLNPVTKGVAQPPTKSEVTLDDINNSILRASEAACVINDLVYSKIKELTGKEVSRVSFDLVSEDGFIGSMNYNARLLEERNKSAIDLLTELFKTI